MTDLMQVDWVRPRHQRGGAEPYHFWYAQNIDDRLQFVGSWDASPVAHFAKFKSVGTQGVLQMLRDMAEVRQSWLAGPPWRTAIQRDPGVWNELLDVVKTDPRHCGGWLGLLTIRSLPSRPAALVDRPSPTSSLDYVTWPPTTSRSLLGILAWLMQGIHMEPANFATGNRWQPNAEMLRFLAGQKATGGPLRSGSATPGFESFSDTVRGMIYENADPQLLHFYLRHLRGHGPEETGNAHHLNQIVSGSDADAVSMKQNLELGMDAVLRGFPAAWSRSGNPGLWNAVVADHIGEWRVGTGNHRTGMTWLKAVVERRAAEWRAASIVTEIANTRVTQRTVGSSITSTLTVSVATMEMVRLSLSDAVRTNTSAAWQQSLQDSLTRLDSLTTTRRDGIQNTTGGSFGTDTAVTAGGETGALPEFLIGKITGEVTETVKWQLQSQFQMHLQNERAHQEATTTSQTTITQETLTAQRERSVAMTQEATQSLTRTLTLGESLTRNVQELQDPQADARQQASLALRGLETALVAINDTLTQNLVP